MEYIALWAIFGVAAAIVGSNRGGSGGNWFLVGLLLGPIGLVLAFTAEAKQMPALFWVMLAFLLIGLILLVLPYYYEWMGTIKSVRR